MATWWLRDLGDRSDLGVVDALGRFQVAAQRAGCSIQLRHITAELTELLHLVGLSEIIGCTGGTDGVAPTGGTNGAGPA